MKILTKEQQEQILQQKAEEIVKSPRWESPTTTFTSKEIDRIRDDALLEAQARLTLQEVGEWLEKRDIIYSTYAHLPLGRDIKDGDIKSFKQGEIPRKGK